MSSHRRAPTAKLRRTGRSLPIALLRTRETVMAHFRPMLAAHGLSDQQWRILRVMDEHGDMDISELSQRALILGPSLTRIIRAFRRKGLVRTARDPADGRRTILRLTAKARRFIRSIAPESAAVYALIEKKAGVRRIEMLLDVLDELRARLDG